MAGATENKAALVLPVTTEREGLCCLVCRSGRDGSSPASNTLSTGVFIDSLVAPLVKEGASFTGLTVMVKDWGAEESVPPPLSCKTMVMSQSRWHWQPGCRSGRLRVH